MRDPETERLDRTRAVQFLLYPVIFSPDLTLEAGRVSQLFRSHRLDQLASVVRDTRAELALPILQVSQVESLVCKANESQVRAYLTAVVDRIAADLLPPGTA